MANGNVSDKQRLCLISIMDGNTGKFRDLKEGDYLLIDPFHIAGMPEIGSIDAATQFLQELDIDPDDHSCFIYELFENSEGEKKVSLSTKNGLKDILANYCLCGR